MFLSLLLTMAGNSAAPNHLYACGDNQVRELRISGDSVAETWRWSAHDAHGLPDDYRTKLLAHIDDCKPVENGRSILITASTGAAVLIDRASGKVRFRAKVPMAHSAALLPGGLIAVALSIHKQGDRLELYDSRIPERRLQMLPLPSGHGAVWDETRARLFALSHNLVQAFTLVETGDGPRLREAGRWALPGRCDGHDLAPAGDGDYLVTTHDGVWRFDPDLGSFSAYAPLNPRLQVKAVSVASGQLAWVQAEENWWAHGFTVMALNGDGARRFAIKGLHLYKVRWVR